MMFDMIFLTEGLITVRAFVRLMADVNPFMFFQPSAEKCEHIMWKVAKTLIIHTDDITIHFHYLSTNRFPHSEHSWLLTFWWVFLTWRSSLPECLNSLPQWGQTCWPESSKPFWCLASWYFKNLAFLKSFPQYWHDKLFSIVECAFLLWTFRPYSLIKTLPQCSQKYNFSPIFS